MLQAWTKVHIEEGVIVKNRKKTCPKDLKRNVSATVVEAFIAQNENISDVQS